MRVLIITFLILFILFNTINVLHFVISLEEVELRVADDIKEPNGYLGNVSYHGNKNLKANILDLVNKTRLEDGHNKTQQIGVKCLPYLNPIVQLVNDTELIKILVSQSNVTRRDQPAECVLILFYSKYCPFSSLAAPHFNALPRAFPKLRIVAINAMAHHLFNTQNGIVGVPTVALFHNGKPTAKYNETEYTLELFTRFITKYTGIEATPLSHVMSSDFFGPVVSVPSKDMDIFLIFSWIFIIICAGYYFTKTKLWKYIVEVVQRNWRESEAHRHLD